MQNIETPRSLNPYLMATTVKDSRPSRVRLLLATVLPLLFILAIQFFHWPMSGRWTLFTPAVIACAWFGGFESGVAATVLSSALVWWFFVPPEHVILKPAGPRYLMGLVFFCTGIVISEILRRLHRNAIALARTQRLLQGVIEHSPNAIAIKDLERRYILVNQAFASLTGVQIEATLQHRAEDVLPGPFSQVVADHEKHVLAERTPALFEATLNGRSLLISHFPLVDETQNAFAIGAMKIDITQQKHDQEALRESLSDLRVAQHVAHVGSWRWDFRTNTTTWSDELYEIFGMDPHPPLPLPLLNPGLRLLSADSVLRLTSAIDTLRREGAPFEVDLEFTRPDGSTRWCTARGEAIRDRDGHITGVTATAADITHIMHLERLREEWTSIIAHDLRQPIGVISSASELIPELHDPRDELGMLQRIQSAAGTLKRMVNDLLDVSLLEAHHLKLERTQVDPSALARETVRRLTHLTGDRVQITESDPQLRMCVDPMRIEQVLVNLLSNAVKYGDPHAPIYLRIDRAATEVRIAVTNHGKGIPADELPRLFDRFARSRTTTGSGVPGLGLGLYITKELVKAHGGRIWAESDPGKTTTFHIALPAVEARREAA